jgi:SAM-dependent methyltransferase
MTRSCRCSTREDSSDDPCRAPIEHRDGIKWDWQAREVATASYDPAVAMLCRHTPPRAEVLEIGVGCGFVLCELDRLLGCRCVGVDVLPEAIDTSRQLCLSRGARVSLLVASGFVLPFPDGSFDMVYSLGVIEHFPEERSLAMLHEHARVCRPGGRVLVATPNGLDLVHTANRKLQGRKYPYHPERSYTPWGLRRLMRRAGLEPTAADGFAPLWSWRQARLLYPLTAALFKTGVLERLDSLSQSRVLSLLGYITAQIASRT